MTRKLIYDKNDRMQKNIIITHGFAVMADAYAKANGMTFSQLVDKAVRDYINVADNADRGAKE